MPDAPPAAALEGARLAPAGLRGSAVESFDLRLEPSRITVLLADSAVAAGLIVAALGGVVSLGGGEIRLHGRAVRRWRADDAIRAGVGTASGETELIAGLPAWRSLILGVEPARSLLRPLGHRRALAHLAIEMARLGIDEAELLLPPEALPRPRRTLMAAARAFTIGRTAVLLDEPAVGLPVETAALVLARAVEAREAGAAVLLATANVQHAWAVADRFVLCYGGRPLAVLGRAETRREELYRAMLGNQDFQELAAQLQGLGVRGPRGEVAPAAPRPATPKRPPAATPAAAHPVARQEPEG